MHSAIPKLTEKQVQDYNENGFLVIPNLLTDSEINAFLSADAERKEKPQWGLHGHVTEPQYRYLAMHPNVTGRVMQLLNGRLRIVQTMYLDKAAKGGTGIAMHQDSRYLPNDPHTLTACWIALTDTDGDNGGLCVVPGSHRLGLQKWHKNLNDKEHASWEHEHDFRDRNGRMWKETLCSFEIDGIREMNIVKLAVPRGAGVIFTGQTIHGSFSNKSVDRPRKAFAIHYVHEDTWVFRTDVQNTMPVELEAEAVASR